MFKTKCVKKLSILKNEFNSIEKKIYDAKEDKRRNEEYNVIDKIKQNPKVFYNYARKKSVIRSSVGPFCGKNGETIGDTQKMCEILSKQYRDICSNPREDILDEIFKNQLFENNSFENTPSLSDIEVTTEKVKKVISKMSNGAAIGPDGLQVQVFK